MVRITRRKIMGVLGSGTEEHRELAEPLGRLVADLGANLLTGGGGGVMTAVSRAFCAVSGRQGVSIGVLPSQEGDSMGTPISGYPNQWIEVPIQTHLPYSGTRGTDDRSRNHINILSADAVIVLPGGAGTASEIILTLRYQKPVLAYVGPSGRIDGFDPSVPTARSLEHVEEFLRGIVGSARCEYNEME